MAAQPPGRMPDRIDPLPDPIIPLAIVRDDADTVVMQNLLDRMCRRVERVVGDSGTAAPMPRLGLAIAREASRPIPTLYEPMVCMVLRGAKRVLIGDRVLHYDAASCFIASVELPATGCILQASPDDPYIVASLKLDRDTLSALIADLPPEPAAPPAAGFGVAPVTTDLIAAWDHLLALLDAPEDIPFLAATREREVLYRLLQGGHGPMLRQIARDDSRLSQVRRAIGWIRAHYDQTIRTETLADLAGMSVPSLHRHFKAATAMSPLQYQKMLRLQTARRLLTASGDAGRTAYAVGYESASQFSREYARLFGAPPARDAERIRNAEPVGAP